MWQLSSMGKQNSPKIFWTKRAILDISGPSSPPPLGSRTTKKYIFCGLPNSDHVVQKAFLEKTNPSCDYYQSKQMP